MKNLILIIAVFIISGNAFIVKANTCPVVATQNIVNENPNSCADPAAVALNFSIVRRLGKDKAEVKIEGIVKNIGRHKFVANGQPLMIVLYEVMPTGQQVVKAKRSLQSLAPGQSATVDIVLGWDIPTATASIIGIFGGDGRAFKVSVEPADNSNDCNRSNNSLQRSATGIDELF